MTYRQLLASNADFRRLWSGQVISEIGDWLNNIAVLALVIELAGRGHEGRAVAWYAIARHLPLFVFGPLAGVAADRLSRKRIMIAADVARAFLALGFLVAGRYMLLPLVYVVGASLFAVSSFFNAAKRASIPNLVTQPDQFLNANALSASTMAATIALGSALGGIAANFAGRDFVFTLNAITFLASAEMIRRIRASTSRDVTTPHDVGPVRHNNGALIIDQQATTLLATLSPPSRPGLPASPWQRIVDDFREGLRYVKSVPVLAAIFIVAAVWGLGNGTARAVYSIFGARHGEALAFDWVPHPTDFGISVLFVAMGLGGVLGALVARRFNQAAGDSLGSRMGRSLFFDGIGLVVFSWMPNLWTASLVLIAREMNFAIWWTAQQTIIMQYTNDRYRGRVFASYETLTTLMMVGAMLAAGAASDTYGVQIVTATGGIVITLSGLLWFFLRRS